MAFTTDHRPLATLNMAAFAIHMKSPHQSRLVADIVELMAVAAGLIL
jgi:hypothetical protein